MKEVAILLLLALVLNGCSTSTTLAQTASGGVWQATTAGGEGDSSGFSFITQFSVGSNGALSISNIQLLNSTSCFGSAAVQGAGTLDVTFNSADQVTGTFSFTLNSSAGDTVTFTSTSVTGTLNGNSLTNGSIIGTWTLAPASGTSCNATSGTFTMTQSS